MTPHDWKKIHQADNLKVRIRTRYVSKDFAEECAFNRVFSTQSLSFYSMIFYLLKSPSPATSIYCWVVELDLAAKSNIN